MLTRRKVLFAGLHCGLGDAAEGYLQRSSPFPFEKVLRVLEIVEGEPSWSRVEWSWEEQHLSKFTLKTGLSNHRLASIVYIL